MERRCYGCMKLKSQSPICEHCGFDGRSDNRAHQLPVGTVLHNQYVIGRVLGQGGFGVTYIAWDAVLETPVAIKEYYPNHYVLRDCRTSRSVFCFDEKSEELFGKSRERFIKEAKILAKLRSVHGIVRIQNLFEENNTAYIVMEYVQGINLKSYLFNLGRPLSAEEMLSVIRPVIYTLGKVHEAELIHRDLSPDNIMLQNDGTVKLLDFGSAREMEYTDGNNELPQSTEAILKHGFAPAEQYQRRGKIGSWTDVYSLCATMYYCMTGSVPNGALERLVGDDNVNWHQIPGLTEKQIETLECGLRIRPEERIQSAQELWQGLFEQKKTVPEKAAEKVPDRDKDAAVLSDANLKASKERNAGKLKAALLAVIAAAGLCVAGLCAVKLQPPKNTSAHLENTEVSLTETGGTEGFLVNPVPQDNEMVEIATVSKGNNTLIGNPEKYFTGIDKSDIVSVTFLDTLADGPADSWDVSEGQDGNVLAWAEEYNGGYAVYIAAEGGVYAANACRGLFKDYDQLAEVNFNDCFYTENAEDMRDMFRHCASITKLDLSGFDTSCVTNMSAMFEGCEKLTEIVLKDFDTSSVTDMSYMFSACKSLITVGLDHFDTSRVTTMCGMFSYCDVLQELDLSGFDTSSVSDMRSMFSDCYNLASLDIGNFKTDRVRYMSYMFYTCRSLESLNLSSFSTSSVTDMREMFYRCENMVTLNLNSFDFRNVSDLSGMFSYCSKLKFLDLGDFDISRHTNTLNMYYGCYKLPSKYKHLA